MWREGSLCSLLSDVQIQSLGKAIWKVKVHSKVATAYVLWEVYVCMCMMCVCEYVCVWCLCIMYVCAFVCVWCVYNVCVCMCSCMHMYVYGVCVCRSEVESYVLLYHPSHCFFKSCVCVYTHMELRKQLGVLGVSFYVYEGYKVQVNSGHRACRARTFAHWATLPDWLHLIFWKRISCWT